MKAKYMASQDQGAMNEKTIEEEKRRAMYGKREFYRPESSNVPVGYSRGD